MMGFATRRTLRAKHARGIRSACIAAITLLTAGSILHAGSIHAQPLDVLIRNGTVIDVKNDINAMLDVGIADGRIAEIAPGIAPDRATTVIDATGLFVTPGLIDIHVHVFHGTEDDAYLSNSYSAVPPDGFTFKSGVTTVVDAGGAGWRNFPQFKAQTIDRSATRVLALLNIVGSGMKGGDIEQNLSDMDPKMAAMMARQHPGVIVGVKLAHFDGPNWEPVDRAVEAGAMAEIPVMVDFGRSDPPLSIEQLFFKHLRPGDIFTHAYAHVERRLPIVDDTGSLHAYVLRAQERGIVFDVGHGGGSFRFSQAVPATQQGFWPNTISTDLHTGSMNGAMQSLANVMSKFLNLGMPLAEVVACATWMPAQHIDRTDLGHLDIGAVADVAVFSLEQGSFGFTDTSGGRFDGDKRLVAELTVREGRVVWDLNGRSRPLWNAR